MIGILVMASFEGSDEPDWPAYISERGGIWITTETTLLILKKFLDDPEMDLASELMDQMKCMRNFQIYDEGGSLVDVRLLQIPPDWDAFRVISRVIPQGRPKNY
jgi:hypothetical protein